MIQRVKTKTSKLQTWCHSNTTKKSILYKNWSSSKCKIRNIKISEKLVPFKEKEGITEELQFQNEKNKIKLRKYQCQSRKTWKLQNWFDSKIKRVFKIKITLISSLPCRLENILKIFYSIHSIIICSHTNRRKFVSISLIFFLKMILITKILVSYKNINQILRFVSILC